MFPRLHVQDSGLDQCPCDVKHLHFPACFSLCYSLLHQCISLCWHEYLHTLNIWSILRPAAISHCRLLLRWPFRVHINPVILQLSPSHTPLHLKQRKHSCRKIRSKVKPCSIIHEPNFKGRRLNNRRKERFPRAAIVFYMLGVNAESSSHLHSDTTACCNM